MWSVISKHHISLNSSLNASMLRSMATREQASILAENGDERIEGSALLNEVCISNICITDCCILYGEKGFIERVFFRIIPVNELNEKNVSF